MIYLGALVFDISGTRADETNRRDIVDSRQVLLTMEKLFN
jgi:hypothetical protein